MEPLNLIEGNITLEKKLCSEHLGLPSPLDVREGVIVARITTHAADIARGKRKLSNMTRRCRVFARPSIGRDNSGWL